MTAELPSITPPTNVTRARWEELNRERVRLTSAIANRPVREATYNTLHTEAVRLENTPTAITPLSVNITAPLGGRPGVTDGMSTYF